jgi:hypothetical protein
VPFLALLLLVSAPDRAPLPDEWGYRPADGEVVAVNPPPLSWLHEKDASSYVVQFANNAQMDSATTLDGVRWSVYTHDRALRPGRYYWRYRIVSRDGEASTWSRTRSFEVPPSAVEFPKPSMKQLKERVPETHPRLFLRPEDVPRLKAWAREGGKAPFEKLIARGNEVLEREPTPEPSVRARASDPATNQYWWSNRVQTIRALQEAEVLAFAWLLTGDHRYGDGARRLTLRLAAWDPDGPTNFGVNCEAAKPMIHRLARAYDWAWPLFTADERAKIRTVLLRRALDAWKSGEVREAAGHLNQPYGSHANRTWHKLAENAIATLGETPESEMFLDYAVTKFFAAYPVWSDDDGGWHEGLNYFGGYMSKAVWWMEIARTALGIDGFKKPFFANFGDYAMYSAPPGSPDLGIGDLAFRAPGSGWSFMNYFVRRTANPYWAWWLDAWKIPNESEDLVLDFLWSETPPVKAAPPAKLPPSKVFRGTGIAVLNSNLLSAADNVQVRFKSSPMGRWSHGHDPHNSFTLNAYGVPLLVNNTYRDLYGSPFHKGWVWSTQAQNAVLVNGEGQKAHTADPGGRIVRRDFQEGLDYVAGDATAAYEGKLTRAFRHIVFVKPDLIFLVDELEAPRPSTFQWMLHAQQEFRLHPQEHRLVLDREAAGVTVDYAGVPVKLRQWTGYSPEPDWRYLKSINSPGIPPQWHVEASSEVPTTQAVMVTVLRTFRRGQVPSAEVATKRTDNALRVEIGSDIAIEFPTSKSVAFASVRRGGREWRVASSVLHRSSEKWSARGVYSGILRPSGRAFRSRN